MAWDDENYLMELPGKWELSRLVFQGDVVVAYAMCSYKGNVLWLHRLVVGADARGRGIGKEIVAELIRVARDEGLLSIGVKTPDDNVLAQKFYHRLGFGEVGQENGYISMNLNISQAGVTVGIHQPNYMPWLGYFYKMYSSNVFVLLDNVAAPSRGYVNRTAVLIQGKSNWLTVPIDRSYPTINKIMQADAYWGNKHLKSLEMHYKKAPFYGNYIDEIAELIRRHSGGSLSEMNSDLILQVSRWLGLTAQVVKSSDFNVDEVSDERLIRLVQLVGGSCYLSGKGGGNYQDPMKFHAAGIGLAYSNFKPVAYRQGGGGEFMPGLSVLDALFNIGAAAIREMFAATPDPRFEHF
jgi:ribosomal protein S18 acetylase RimI-like enzyme